MQYVAHQQLDFLTTAIDSLLAKLIRITGIVSGVWMRDATVIQDGLVVRNLRATQQLLPSILEKTLDRVQGTVGMYRTGVHQKSFYTFV